MGKEKRPARNPQRGGLAGEPQRTATPVEHVRAIAHLERGVGRSFLCLRRWVLPFVLLLQTLRVAQLVRPPSVLHANYHYS